MRMDVIKRVIVLKGSSVSIGRNLGFHSVIGLLERWARIREDDDNLVRFNKLEAAVRNIFLLIVKSMIGFKAF